MPPKLNYTKFCCTNTWHQPDGTFMARVAELYRVDGYVVDLGPEFVVQLDSYQNYVTRPLKYSERPDQAVECILTIFKNPRDLWGLFKDKKAAKSYGKRHYKKLTEVPPLWLEVAA